MSKIVWADAWCWVPVLNTDSVSIYDEQVINKRLLYLDLVLGTKLTTPGINPLTFSLPCWTQLQPTVWYLVGN